MRHKHKVLLVLATVWVAVDFWLVASNLVFRETILVRLARFVDRMPEGISHRSLAVFWIVLLFGWLIPLGIGLMPMLRRRH